MFWPCSIGEDAEAGGYYLVMPRAEGSLSDELTKRGILPPTESVNILMQNRREPAEAETVVHRDLKPGNVLFHDGRWKIADFGIARFVEDATSANTVRGFLSAPYAAPEQWLGQHATHATGRVISVLWDVLEKPVARAGNRSPSRG